PPRRWARWLSEATFPRWPYGPWSSEYSPRSPPWRPAGRVTSARDGRVASTAEPKVSGSWRRVARTPWDRLGPAAVGVGDRHGDNRGERCSSTCRTRERVVR